MLNTYSEIKAAIKSKDPKLDSLSFYYNEKEEIPEEILELTNIIEIDIQNPYWQTPSSLPKIICKMTWLKQLSISGFLWDTLPEELANLKNLEEFSFAPSAYTKRKTLSELNNRWIFSAFPKLKRLSIPNLFKEGFPLEISKLKDLEELTITNNFIKELPNEIAQLKKLRYLEISTNKFDVFPPVIGKLKQLETLSLSLPMLKTFPVELLNLPKLKQDGIVIATGASATLDKSPVRFFNSVWRAIHQYKFSKEQSLFLFDCARNERTDFADATTEQLLILLHSRVKVFEQAALTEIERRTALQPLQLPAKGETLWVVGKTTETQKYWAEKLQNFDIQLVKTPDAKTKHALLAVASGWITAQLQGKTLWTEKLLKKYIDQIEKPFLIQPQNSETDDYIKNVRQLLQSADFNNIELALEMIKSGGLPQAILTDFFALLKIRDLKITATQKSNLRKKIFALLQQYAEPSVIVAFQRRYDVMSSYIDNETLYKNLLFYCTEIPALNLYEICINIYRSEGKGHVNSARYGAACLQGDDLQRFVKETKIWDENTATLDLSNMKFLSLPEPLTHFPAKIALLKGNQFRNADQNNLAALPMAFSQIKSLEIIDLTYSYAYYKINELADQLPQLHTIRISRNYESNYINDIKALPHIKWEIIP